MTPAPPNRTVGDACTREGERVNWGVNAERLTHERDHDACEDGGEFARLLHRVRDRDHEPDALEREDRGADQEREVARVEQLDARHAARGDDLRLAAEDVDQAGDDEDVRDKRRRAQPREVAHEREREEDDELEEDEVREADEARAAGHSGDERLQVLGDEDDVGGDKAHLGDDDRGEDGVAHVGAIERAADVCGDMSGREENGKGYLPPNEPETTNLALTRRRKE
jgi:hypothetical protein